MGETYLFLTISGASAFSVSVWILRNRIAAASRATAQAFYWISITLSVAAFIWTILNVLGWLSVNTTSSWWFRILIYRAWLVIGTALSSAVLLILNSSIGPRVEFASTAARTFLTSPYILKGVSLSVSISFVCTEIGKLTHDADMRQFFSQSGYSSWFLYFIIIAETVGAIGLLVPRTAIAAAISLSGIMIGAIGTHMHNRDPFSDSLEALHLLVLLACILVIRLLQEKQREQLVSGRS